MTGRKHGGCITLLTLLFAGLLMWPVVAWQLMLTVGIVHLNWWHAVPLMGYRTSLAISFLMFSMLTGGTLTTSVYAKANR